jgi:steroid delta-isomerase-like uncharacterized protein
MKRIGKKCMIGLIVLLMFSLVSISLSALAQRELEKNKELVRRYVDFWNSGDFSIVDEILSPDFVQHDLQYLSGDVRGIVAVKQLLTENSAAFPDSKITIIDLVAEGDKVAKLWSWTGTHKGEMSGIPPTGKKVTLEYCLSIYRIQAGKIAEIWMGGSGYSFMQQLGVIP